MCVTVFIFSAVGSFHSLLRGLVAEFTLAENPAMTTTSLLRTVCHKDDSILLGSWMQETDHKFVEEQVCVIKTNGTILSKIICFTEVLYAPGTASEQSVNSETESKP